MALLMNLSMGLTGISTLMLIALLYVYSKNLKSIKSKFTIGLFVFACLFLLQNLVSLYYYITMMEYYVNDVMTHVFIFSILQTIAFIILLVITWE